MKRSYIRECGRYERSGGDDGDGWDEYGDNEHRIILCSMAAIQFYPHIHDMTDFHMERSDGYHDRVGTRDIKYDNHRM